MLRLKTYETKNVKVFRATKKEDAQKIAIHLLYPNVWQIAAAVEDAEAKMFPMVILHDTKTWPSKRS